MAMQAELIELSHLRSGPHWQRWSALAAHGPPHLSPEFFALAATFFDREASLVAVAWEGGTMFGALPMVLANRRLHGLSCDVSPGYDFTGTCAGLAAIWRCLAVDPRWDEIVLDRIPSTSLLASELPWRTRASACVASVQPDVRRAYLPLGRTAPALPPEFVARLFEDARRADEHGIALELVAIPTRADLDEAWEIEASAWSPGQPLRDDPRITRFYDAAARVFGRRRQAALAFLQLDGRRVASAFLAQDDRVLYVLALSVDPFYASAGAGDQLIWHVAVEAERRGLRELQFAGPDATWQHAWTAARHERSVIAIDRRSTRGRLARARRELAELAGSVVRMIRSVGD